MGWGTGRLRAWLLCFVGLCLCGMRVADGSTSPLDQVAFYLEAYGEVRPPDDPMVGRAHEVFARVLAVADKSQRRGIPKLVVVKSLGDPWAIALPDGHIVLSLEAVRICHQEVHAAEAATRLAFVLGHELAHLAHDDFWHHEVYSFLATEPSTRHLAGFLETHRQTKQLELAADDKGFIFAALAGYPVDELLATPEGKRDFLAFWVQQTNARVSPSHPTAADRAALLRQRLHRVQDVLGFFYFGMRLSHFDYCDDAVYFLREFRKSYPGREVHNNLGFCYLQMARQSMDPRQAYFYWMPLVLDGETRAGVYVRRGETSLKGLRRAVGEKSEGFLREALASLQRATEADPEYLPAKVNLAVTWLYLGKPHRARAVLEDARAVAPQDPEIKMLEAVSLYEQSDADVDLWPVAVDKLEKLLDARSNRPIVRFNLARLLDVRPGAGEARAHWNALAALADPLPPPVRDIVCAKQTKRPATVCAQAPRGPARPLPWSWPLPAKGFTPMSPDLRNTVLRGWQRNRFDWMTDTLHGEIYRSPDGKAEILALDDFIQMQVLNGDLLGTDRSLAGYCPTSLRKRTLAQGVVWSCGNWAALTDEGQIREAWWVAQ